MSAKRQVSSAKEKNGTKTPSSSLPRAGCKLLNKNTGLRKGTGGRPGASGQSPDKMSDTDLRRLVHELQAHQFELEQQNVKLCMAYIQLEKSCCNYSSLHDFAPIGYFTFDNDGLILEVNLTGAGKLSRERSSLLDKPFSLFIHEDDREVFYLHREQVFERKTRCDCEIRLKRKDGSEFYAQLSSIIMPGSECKCNRMLSTLTDITERKKIEEALLWESSVNSTMAELSTALISEVSLDEIGSIVLRHAKRLTVSSSGFVGCIDQETGYLICSTMVGEMWDECRVPDKDIIFKKFNGLWGWVLNNCEPLLTNSPDTDPRSSGTPPGHLPIKRFLSVPALIGDTLVGQVALANSQRDYTERDLDLGIRLAALYAIAVNNRRKQRAMEDSEEKYRDLVDNSLYGIFKTNLKGDVLYANEAAAGIFEYDSIEEIISEGVITRYKNPEDRATFIDHLKKSGRIDRCEVEMLTRTGKTRNVMVSARLEANIISGMLMDITDRRQMEIELSEHREHLQELVEKRTIELKKSEERYRCVVEGATDAIISIDTTGVVASWNAGAEKMFGYKPEEILGRPIYTLSPEDGRDERQYMMKQMKAHGFIYGYETERLAKDGRRFPVEISLNAMKDDKGDITGYFSIIRDITERRHAEKSLHESEERYRRITVALTDYIYSVSVEAGRAAETKHSESCFVVTGYTKEEFAADPYLWIRMIPEEDRDLLRQQINQVLSGHFPSAVEHRIIKKDGVIRWVESNVVPYKDKDGNIISYDGIVRDITDRKGIEAQLLHAQKLESLGTLAGGVAHDFNNILTVISSIVSILRRKMYEDEPLKIYVEEIQSAVEDAANLTKDLLVFSRKQSLNPEAADVNELIAKLEKFLLRIIGEDIELRIITADGSLNVMVDFNQMEQVMMNLFANARDAMPEGGALTVSTKSEVIDNEFIKSLGYGVPGRYAVISVSDTGTGMDEAVKEKIFEPFFTTKKVGMGTGLGLSIAYGIIKQHRGYLTVESRPGKGTTFMIYLPLIDRIATGDKDVSLPDSSRSIAGTETVLVVEDNAKLRGLMTSYLQDLGYSTITAEDGEEAVSRFRENKDSIDVIVSDVIMPKKSGKDAYEEMIRIKPDAKILFLSGYSREIMHLKNIIDSGIEIIPKPILLDELVGKIRKTLDKDL